MHPSPSSRPRQVSGAIVQESKHRALLLRRACATTELAATKHPPPRRPIHHAARDNSLPREQHRVAHHYAWHRSAPARPHAGAEARAKPPRSNSPLQPHRLLPRARVHVHFPPRSSRAHTYGRAIALQLFRARPSAWRRPQPAARPP